MSMKNERGLGLNLEFAAKFSSSHAIIHSSSFDLEPQHSCTLINLHWAYFAYKKLTTKESLTWFRVSVADLTLGTFKFP